MDGCSEREQVMDGCSQGESRSWLAAARERAGHGWLLPGREQVMAGCSQGESWSWLAAPREGAGRDVLLCVMNVFIVH